MQPGTRLGPYEIVSPLGAGGMGEVYRARDTRLGREVALKVVHPRLASDPGRLSRFEKEARAAAQLDHPNILVVHDVGTHEGNPYIVSELLDGESLREKLGAPLQPRKAIEFGLQIADGLAAAHDKGIVHRDLKPENLFVTRDGRIKILDFGLAKLTQPEIWPVSLTEAPTATPGTEPGIVMGTVSYMSPEQVMGRPLDARSDLFSLGVVLYEMLSGKRPFQRQTAPETMAAILREDPPELSGTNRSIPPGFGRVVRHCLEKEPSNRFQSARDVAFDLGSLTEATSAGTAPPQAPRTTRRLAVAALSVVLLATFGAGLFSWGKHVGKTPWPTFKRITLRRGRIDSARFTPDFQSVVYSARWQGKPAELFVQRLASSDARPLGIANANVIGTAGGEVIILRIDGATAPMGTLARLPLEGGTSRDILTDVVDATCDRNDTRLVIVRAVKGRYRLEYPVGKVLFETAEPEGILNPRLSPNGDQIAFILRPSAGSDFSGDICVVNQSGQRRTLSKGWAEIWSLAWSPNGSEVWFTATRIGASLGLHAVTLSGKERFEARLPGSLVLQDIAPDGRLLLIYGQSRRSEMRGRMAGDAVERDLSWLDGTITPVLAPDGTRMVFQEWGEGGGVEGSTYHWRVGSPTPTRLGVGTPWSVSPDWRTVLVCVGFGKEATLKLVPIGAGETMTLPRGSVQSYVWGAWHPDGKRIVFLGSDDQGAMRLFVQDVTGGSPRPSAIAHGLGPFSPDGHFIAARPKEGEPAALFPIDGAETRPIPFLTADDVPLAFSAENTSLFVTDPRAPRLPLRVLRLDLKTGHRDPYLALAPPDFAGVERISSIQLTPNGRFYSYSYIRTLSDLYVAERLK
jgi:serine/threonine protein kinase